MSISLQPYFLSEWLINNSHSYSFWFKALFLTGSFKMASCALTQTACWRTRCFQPLAGFFNPSMKSIHHLMPSVSCLQHKLRNVSANHQSLRYASTRNPEFTSIRYPQVSRGQYSQVTSDDVAYFRSVLPADGQVLTAEDDLEGYNVDWLQTVRGR